MSHHRPGEAGGRHCLNRAGPTQLVSPQSCKARLGHAILYDARRQHDCEPQSADLGAEPMVIGELVPHT